MKKIFFLYLLLTLTGCAKEELFSEQARHDLWLFHEGAEMPIVVEGNTSSKIFLILLHGGPGGSAQEFNAYSKAFSDPLEVDYAMVYYDQRNAGLARGEWDEDKLTIEQHVEDLDKVIDLLNHKYGDDIKIFLSGHSWGGFLGTAYLLEPARQAKVKAWINIAGGIHRNLRNFHNLATIKTIALEQLAAMENVEKWETLLQDTENELNNGPLQYDAETESVPNALLRRAENLISEDRLLDLNGNGGTAAIYGDNYDVFLILINGRKGTLIEQLYAFDETLEADLNKITLPVLSIYGRYDVVTAAPQGEYLNANVSTPEEDRKFVLLNKSGHSCTKNEPVVIAEEIKMFIEKYQ